MFHTSFEPSSLWWLVCSIWTSPETQDSSVNNAFDLRFPHRLLCADITWMSIMGVCMWFSLPALISYCSWRYAANRPIARKKLVRHYMHRYTPKAKSFWSSSPFTLFERSSCENVDCGPFGIRSLTAARCCQNQHVSVTILNCIAQKHSFHAIWPPTLFMRELVLGKWCLEAMGCAQSKTSQVTVIAMPSPSLDSNINLRAIIALDASHVLANLLHSFPIAAGNLFSSLLFSSLFPLPFLSFVCITLRLPNRFYSHAVSRMPKTSKDASH